MATVSTQIRPRESLGHTPSNADVPAWYRIYLRYGAHIGFSSAALILAFGWWRRGSLDISADTGVGYALGIGALTCMLLLLLYPLRKRLKFLAFLGPTKNWFRTHMILGTVGPIAALYHCNFELGSFNSRVALFSALIVAGSGFVGRYIYSKIHHGLYGRRANLNELRQRVELAAPTARRLAGFVPELTKRLADFDSVVLTPPKNFAACVALPFRLAFLTRLEYWKLMRFVRRHLLVASLYSPVLSRHGEQFAKVTKLYVTSHLRQVRRLAEFVAYQRLFALWHKVHRPFFVLLLIAVAIHVFAVHRF
jgi:hypothetical protein